MSITRTTTILVAISILTAGVVSASDSTIPVRKPLVRAICDGATPVSTPMVIEKPGHYMVMRDILSTTGPAITVRADGVILSLNGYTLKTQSNSVPTIEASEVANLEIRGGSVVGGDPVINVVGDGAKITDLHISCSGEQGGIVIDGARAIIRDNRIDCGIIGGEPRVVTAGAYAVVENNYVFTWDGYGVDVGHMSTVKNNVIRIDEEGWALEFGTHSIIMQNTLVGMVSISSASVFTNNTVLGTGVFVCGAGNQVQENTIRNAWIGLDVSSDHNLITDNVMYDHGAWGLHFSASSEGNVYRGNVARNSESVATCPGSGTSDFCDEGVGNTSGGGNFMPGPM